MKRFLCFLVILLLMAEFSHVAGQVAKDYQMAGSYHSYVKNINYIDFKCTNSRVRVEIFSGDIARIRMIPSGHFEPNEPYVVIKYKWSTTCNRIFIQQRQTGLERKLARFIVHNFLRT